MATLRDIKLRISGVKNIAKITQAMKMVAAAKMNRAQTAINSARPYVDKMGQVISNVIASLNDSYSNKLLNVSETDNHYTIIVVSADKGLCGAFNNNLFKKVTAYISEKEKNNTEFEYNMISVGKKATEYFKKRNYNLIKEFNQVFAELKFDIIEDIIEPVKYDFVNNNTDKVIVFYNEFVSIIKQDPKNIQLLPLDPDSLAEESETNENSSAKEYIYEPQQAAILDNLLPKLVDIRLWKTLLDSNAAEQAARMFAMDNATTNANDLISHLNLVYNKERQSSITTEMLEIVSGANALQD